jgi:hypothetical protein
VLADKIRTAFYVAAPASIAKAMRLSIERICSSSAAMRDDSPGLLCRSTRRYYYREVLITGYKGMDGYICARDLAGRGVKYVVSDMIPDDESCVFTRFDSGSGTYIATL